MPVLVGLGDGRTGFRAQRLDLFDAYFDVGEFTLGDGQLVAHIAKLLTYRVAAVHRALGVFGIQACLGVAYGYLNRVGAPGDACLASEGAELAVNLPQQIVKSTQVRFGIGQLAQRAFLALAVLQDAGGLFDERAVAGRIGLQNRIQSSLTHNHVHLLAKTGIGEEFLNVEQTALRAVDRVFGASVAEDGAGDGDFRVIDIERVIGIIDGQAHLCTAQWRAGGRACENHVLHRSAAQVFGALLTHYPDQGVDDVRLARTVGADDRRDAGLEAQRGGGGEGFESAEGEFLEIHGVRLFSVCPGIRYALDAGYRASAESSVSVSALAVPVPALPASLACSLPRPRTSNTSKSSGLTESSRLSAASSSALSAG